MGKEQLEIRVFQGIMRFPNEEMKVLHDEILPKSMWLVGNVLKGSWRESQCLSLNKEKRRLGYDLATSLNSALRKCLNNWQNNG